MTEEKQSFKFSIKLRSNFRRNQEYPLSLQPTDEGWEALYFAQRINDKEKDASHILKIVNSGDGTEFPAGIGLDFIQAWDEINNGGDLEGVKSKLQRAVDRPIERYKK